MRGSRALWSVAEEALLPAARWAGVGFSGRQDGAAFAAALLETEAVAVHLQDVDVVGEPVEQSAGEAFGAEDLVHSWKGRLLVTIVEPRS